MNLDNGNFLMTVNLAMFKVEDQQRNNVKRLPKKDLMVLLSKRHRDPFKNCWSFPYGFVGIDESLDDAVSRILKQKTDMENIYFEQLYTWGAVDRDPSARVIATSYMAVVQKDKIRDEAIEKQAGLCWFRVQKKHISTEKRSDLHTISKYSLTLQNQQDDITIAYEITQNTYVNGFEKRTHYQYEAMGSTDTRMAYDHIKILDYALDRIKNKVLYTNIAFGLIPSQFTLTELQQVYEVLLGKQLIKSNFRQLIRKKVEETHDTKKDGAYRPSRLYTLKKSSIIDLPEEFE